MKHVFIISILVALVGCNSGENTKKTTDSSEKVVSIISTTPYEKAYEKALLLWDIPVKRKFIETSYGKAHVVICGPKNGEPLVLLHGMNASSTMWYPNIKALSKKHRVYAIDFFLEPGRSEKHGEVENTHQIVEWYAQIFDSLNLQKYSVIGASRGGWLALNIALREKGKVTKIALLSPAQTFSWISPGKDLLSNLIYTVAPERDKLRKILQTLSSDVDNIDQVFIDQYYIATQDAQVHKVMVEMTPFDDAELKTIDVPVLVLIGDDDFINKDKNLSKAQELFLKVETKVVSNAGHFLSIDQAKEVNILLLDFLKKN